MSRWVAWWDKRRRPPGDWVWDWYLNLYLLALCVKWGAGHDTPVGRAINHALNLSVSVMLIYLLLRAGAWAVERVANAVYHGRSWREVLRRCVVRIRSVAGNRMPDPES